LQYVPKTDEMRSSNGRPDVFKQKHCFFASLINSQADQVRVGKIGDTKQGTKRQCAIALLKYLHFSKGLPSLCEMVSNNSKVKKHFHVFLFICSVEFSLRANLSFIYNSVNFATFLGLMDLYENVKECHTAWIAIEDKGKTSHWIRFDINEKKFKLFSIELARDELVNFDKKNKVSRYLKFDNRVQQNILVKYYIKQDIRGKNGVWEYNGAEWRVDEILERNVVRKIKRQTNDIRITKKNGLVEGAWYLVKWASVNGETFVE
jgi:hypothetical protein